MGKAIKNLKYPSEITLETLKQLREADIKKGHAPNITNKDNARFSNDMPLSDTELKERIKGSDKRILTRESEEELEAIASSPILLQAEHASRYNGAIKQTQENIHANINEIRQDIAQGHFIASNDIKNNNEILQEALNATNFTYTPDYAIARFDTNGKNYSLTISRNNLAFINDETPQITPRSYDEIQALNAKTQNDFDTYKQQLENVITYKQEKAEAQEKINLSTKSTIDKDLSTQEIKAVIDTWDLSKEFNGKNKQRLIISKVDNAEIEELSNYFNFKGNKDVVREIDSHQLLHTLKQHGDQTTESQRGQIAITIDDITNYQDIVKNHDFKNIQDNGKIVYAKQINGHHIVLEEVLEGQDKIRFFDMWKQKGQLNEKVLLSHSQRPKTIPSPSLESHMPNNYSNSTPNKQTTQAINKDLELTQTITPELKHKISQK